MGILRGVMTRSEVLSRDDQVLLSERIEVELLRSWCQAASPAEGERLGLRFRAIGSGIALTLAAVDVLMYHRVLGLGLDAPASGAELEAALRLFQESGARRCMAQPSPLSEAGHMRGLLASRDFVRHNYWIKLIRDVAPVPDAPTDLDIRPLEPEHGPAFGRIVVEALRHPDSLAPWIGALVGRERWWHFGAFDHGEPVATGSLFVSGEIAWLGFGMTRPSHRRHGAQSALIARRIDAARTLGCRWLSVETAADTPEKPNPSTHNLRRLGFRDLYQRWNWVKVLTPAPV